MDNPLVSIFDRDNAAEYNFEFLKSGGSNTTSFWHMNVRHFSPNGFNVKTIEMRYKEKHGRLIGLIFYDSLKQVIMQTSWQMAWKEKDKRSGLSMEADSKSYELADGERIVGIRSRSDYNTCAHHNDFQFVIGRQAL